MSILAMAVASGVAGNSSGYVGCIGAQFTVGSSPIQVVGLGGFVDHTAGTWTNSKVFVITNAAGTVVASFTATVANLTDGSATQTGQIYIWPITPVTLSASTVYYCECANYSAADKFLHAVSSSVTGNTGGGLISFNGANGLAGGIAGYNGSADGAGSFGDFGASFQFQALSASMTPSPTTEATGGGNVTITLTGTSTSWTSGATASLSGGTGASIVSQSITGQVITAVVNVGTGAGTLTFTDSTDSASCNVTVTLGLPGTPTGLSGTPGNNQVALTWTAPASGGTVVTYTVLRGLTSGSETSLATGITLASYTDSTAVNGTAYYYKVQAVNATGSGSLSAEAGPYTPATGVATTYTATLSAASGPTGTPITITFAPNATPASTIVITPAIATITGTFSPTTVSLTTSGSQTCTFTPTSVGTGPISYTHTGGGFAGSDPASNSFTASLGTTTILPNDAKILYSPGTWDVTSSRALTPNPGAYLSLRVDTITNLTLTFDTSHQSSTTIDVVYRVDKGKWIKAAYAASIDCTGGTPLATLTGGGAGAHFLEFAFEDSSQTGDYGATPSAAVYLTGIVIDNGASYFAPVAKPNRVLIFGDSRLVGFHAAGPTTNSGIGSWGFMLRDYLDAEVGQVGYSGQGMSQVGNAGEPKCATSYAFLYSGKARSFAGITQVIEAQGYNDSPGNGITTGQLAADYATFWAGIIAAGIPANKCFHATWQDAALASTAASACATASVAVGAAFSPSGQWNSDGLHPWVAANAQYFAPTVASQAIAAGIFGGSSGGNSIFQPSIFLGERR